MSQTNKTYGLLAEEMNICYKFKGFMFSSRGSAYEMCARIGYIEQRWHYLAFSISQAAISWSEKHVYYYTLNFCCTC
jgi:hypothetical protein